jgi:hypothetical protein
MLFSRMLGFSSHDNDQYDQNSNQIGDGIQEGIVTYG